MAKQIDLFRPYMNAGAQHAAGFALEYTMDGRLMIGQGERVETFEASLAKHLRAPGDVLTVNSGTSALDLAFHLSGLNPADDRSARYVVITTPMTCSATNSPIVTRGGRIMWADVDPITGNIDPKSVADCIRRCVKINALPAAVVAVDWGGRLCDYVTLRREMRAALDEHTFTKGLHVPIIQDAAHAFGAWYGGLPFLQTPQRGTYTCFSFQAIKHLTTVDGGALVCMDPKDTARARLLRWYGLDRTTGESFRCSQDIAEVGYKYHMNDVAASIGIENLRDMGTVLAQHRNNAYRYAHLLRNIPGVRFAPYDVDAAYWLFTVLVDDQQGFIDHLSSEGIGASQVHRRNDEHAAFIAAEVMENETPPRRVGLDAFASQEVAIPVGWWVKPEEIERVATVITQWSIKTHPAAYSYGIDGMPAETTPAPNPGVEAAGTASGALDKPGSRLVALEPEQRRAVLVRAGIAMTEGSAVGVADAVSKADESEASV